jgi:hypothetical protein
LRKLPKIAASPTNFIFPGFSTNTSASRRSSTGKLGSDCVRRHAKEIRLQRLDVV